MPRATKKPRADALYGIHPAVLMTQKWVTELKQKTGRSLDEWIKFIRKEGPPTETARRDWLKQHSPERHPFWVMEIDRQIAGWLTLKPFLPRSAYRGTAEVSVYVNE